MNGDKENTPLNSRYPQRIRHKAKYYEEFEMSLEEKSNKKLKKNAYNSSYEDSSSSDVWSEVVKVEKQEEEEQISEYERLRLKNLEENRKMMIELGLIDPNKEQPKIKPHTAKPRSTQIKSKKISPPEPQKRSLRLLKRTPEGKELSSIDFFQQSPIASPLQKEEKTRLEEEMLHMDELGESSDFLDSLKSTLSQSSTMSSLESVENLIDGMRKLELVAVEKVNSTRIQSMCVHPMEYKLLVISGSKTGELGMWNATDGKVACFSPHLRPINCISVDVADHTKFYTTSFDGTVRRAAINSSAFEMVYQTDEKQNMCHLTWHSQVDEHSLLVAHGSGEAAVVDTRSHKAERWYHCHPRSIRTIHIHPQEPHYFLTASGTGECKIFDLRSKKKHVDEWVGEIPPPKQGKGLTSAFFSPDGKKVVTTCNDDFLRIHDVSELSAPKEMTKIVHDNHTGRWLSVFKAIWHPHSSDMIIVGSMLPVRQIQMFNSNGRLVKILKDENLTTINSVITLHPSLPILVGGNSSGKTHVFTTPELSSLYVKIEDLE